MVDRASLCLGGAQRPSGLGTTYAGGANGKGTLFKISSSGAKSTLYSFGASATDGQSPTGAIVMDSSGNLFGTTQSGGVNGTGTVFKFH